MLDPNSPCTCNVDLGKRTSTKTKLHYREKKIFSCTAMWLLQSGQVFVKATFWSLVEGISTINQPISLFNTTPVSNLQGGTCRGDKYSNKATFSTSISSLPRHLSYTLDPHVIVYLQCGSCRADRCRGSPARGRHRHGGTRGRKARPSAPGPRGNPPGRWRSSPRWSCAHSCPSSAGAGCRLVSGTSVDISACRAGQSSVWLGSKPTAGNEGMQLEKG